MIYGIMHSGMRKANMRLELISKFPTGKKHPVPILFIHGAYAGAWCWNEYFLDYFAKHGYCSHGLSLRGHGGSEGYENLNLFSIFDYVVDVIRTVHQLDRPPILIGHSMGGWIVQKYLLTAPAAAGILMAPVPRSGLFSVSVKMLATHPFLSHKINMMNMLPKGAWQYFISPEELHRLFFGKEPPSKNEEKYLNLIQEESYKAILDMFHFTLEQPTDVDVPVLVLGGESDIIIPPDIVEFSASAYGTHAHIFPDMGHAMMLGRNWHQAADHILGWLGQRKF